MKAPALCGRIGRMSRHLSGPRFGVDGIGPCCTAEDAHVVTTGAATGTRALFTTGEVRCLGEMRQRSVDEDKDTGWLRCDTGATMWNWAGFTAVIDAHWQTTTVWLGAMLPTLQSLLAELAKGSAFASAGSFSERPTATAPRGTA